MFSKINRAFAKSRAEDGFTLIELLIVIVIIGILAAIAVPVFLNQQKAAINATVKSDVRNTTANVILAINKVPTATGFVVYGPGDTLATTKMVGAPSKVVTVPAGQVGVEAVRSRNNVIVINGSVAAGYEVIGCNPDTKFGWKFISNTGLFADAPDCSTATGGGGAPVMNAAQTITDPNTSATYVVYQARLPDNGNTDNIYFCVAMTSLGSPVSGTYFMDPGYSNNGVEQWGGSPFYRSLADLRYWSGDSVGVPYQSCNPYPGALRYGTFALWPNSNVSGMTQTYRIRLDYGNGVYAPNVAFNPGNWTPTPLG